MNGNTPLVEASERGHKDIVQILTENEADVNLDSSPIVGAGFSKRKRPFPKLPDIKLPLMTAVTLGYEDIVKHLLIEGAHVNKPNNEGWTELHIASYNGNVSVVEMLVQHGAAVDGATELGATALSLASQEGHANVVLFLLKHGADLDHTQSDGATPIMLAAQSGHDQVVDLLIKHQASYSAIVNGKATTAMHLAMQSGHSQTAHLMLRQTQHLHMDLASKLLLTAALKGDVKVVQRLLALGVDTEVYMVIDGECVTPLMTAVFKGHQDVVDVLLTHGADFNVHMSNDAITPLVTAIHLNHTDIVDLILNHYQGNPADLPNKGYGPGQLTPLETAAGVGNLKTFNCLLSHGADPTLKNMRHLRKETAIPLMCQLVMNAKKVLLKSLLDHEDNPDQPCYSTIIPLLLAVYQDHVDITDLLLSYDAQTYLHFPGSNYISALNFAVHEGMLEIVKLLLKRNFDLEVIDNFCIGKVTSLGVAAIRGHSDVAATLLANGANINANPERGTPLFMAADFGNTEVVKILLEHHANTEVTEEESGATPLFVASQNGHADMVKLLLEYGANKNAGVSMVMTESEFYDKVFQSMPESMSNDKDKSSSTKPNSGLDNEGMFDLDDQWNMEHFDFVDGHFTVDEPFKERRSELDNLHKQTRLYIPVLYQAAQYNQTDVVKILIQYGADTEIPARFPGNIDTALHKACTFGFKDIVEILLEAGANVNSRNSLAATPLHYAVLMKRQVIIDLLIKHGADVMARDEDGQTRWDVDWFRNTEFTISLRNQINSVLNRTMELKKQLLKRNMEYATKK